MSINVKAAARSPTSLGATTRMGWTTDHFPLHTYMYTLSGSSLLHVDHILPTQIWVYHSQYTCWPSRDFTPLNHDQSAIRIGLRDTEFTAPPIQVDLGPTAVQPSRDSANGCTRQDVDE